MKTDNEVLKELYKSKKYSQYVEYLENVVSLSNNSIDYYFYLDKLISVYFDLDDIQKLEKLKNDILSNDLNLRMRALRIEAKLLNYRSMYLESYELLNEILKIGKNIDINNNELFLIEVRIALSALYRKIKRNRWAKQSIDNLKIAEELLNRFSEEINLFGFENNETLGLLYYEYALNYEEMGELSKAYHYMNLAKNIGENIKFSPVYLSLLNLQITILVSKGEINQLKEFAIEVLSLKDKSSLNGIELIDIYNNIARGLFKIDEYDYAIGFLNKAINIMDHNDLVSSRVSNIYNTIGLCYLYNGDPEKALQFFQKDLSLQYAIKNKNNAACGSIYNNIGKAYYKLAKYDLAEQAYLESVSVKKQFDDAPNNFSSVYNNLAELYLEMAQNSLGREDYISKAKNYIMLDENVRSSEFVKYDIISILTAIRIYNYTKEYEQSYLIAQKAIKHFRFKSGHDSISSFIDLLDLLEELCLITSDEVSSNVHKKCEKLYFKNVNIVENKNQYLFILKSLYEIIYDVYNVEPEIKNNFIIFNIESNVKILVILSSNIKDVNESIRYMHDYGEDCQFRVITNRFFRYSSRGKIHSNVKIFLYSDYKSAIENKQSIYENITLGIFKNGTLPTKDSWDIKNEKTIGSLREVIHKTGVNLFLGAGASIDDGGKTWDDLIESLFSQNINLASSMDVIERNIDNKQYIKDLNLSPLSLGKFLQNNNTFFIDNLKSILYSKEFRVKEGSILSIIAQNINFFNNIVTYNYDDYLERYLKHYGKKYEIICNESDYKKAHKKLAIYHVHGFLPHKSKNDANLVWREEDYHELYENMFTWNNRIQLNFLRNDYNLFIGHSLTDPNLRRLLDSVSKIKINSSNYVFLRDNAIDSTYRLIQENIASQINIKIIWVQEYEEIKCILKNVLQEQSWSSN